MNQAALIDEIYEAGVLPERWPVVLDRLAAIADAKGTLLFAAAPGKPSWLSSEAIRSLVEDWINSPFLLKNPRGERLIPIKEPRFLTDLDALTMEEIEKDDYYQQFLKPRGLGWCVGTSIRSPSGDALVFSIEKAFDKGPVPAEIAAELDQLRPHLARAALLSGRIGLERARATVAAFEAMGLPAVVITPQGRALVVSAAVSQYASDIRIGARDEVQFANAAAQAILIETIEGRRPTGCSIPVAGAGKVPFVAHVMPLRGAGLDVFSGAAFLLYITPVTQQVSPSGELLRALFDLSPAEARVAGLIAEGQSVDAIADSLAVTPNTVRTQLKAIFTKTGVGRQAELATLLSAAGLQKQPWKQRPR